MSPMTESKFLAGKVSKWTLPVVEQPPSPLKLKRLLLPQGELANIYDAEEGIRFLTFLELRAGSVRGNHCHKVKEEFFYVIQGEVALLVQDVESGKPVGSLPLLGAWIETSMRSATNARCLVAPFTGSVD